MTYRTDLQVIHPWRCDVQKPPRKVHLLEPPPARPHPALRALREHRSRIRVAQACADGAHEENRRAEGGVFQMDTRAEAVLE